MKAAVAARGSLVAAHQMDRSMQSLYGGIITHPDAIAENAVLEFELDLIRDGDNSESVLTNVRIDGIRGPTNVVTRAKTV
jgi:hypothetical protein